jgi:hypothetical protein
VISRDTYTSLVEFPKILTPQHLSPLRDHVVYILKTLFENEVFYVLPAIKYKAQNPCVLPREVFVQDELSEFQMSVTSQMPIGTRLAPMDRPKKKGRPTKRDRMKKAKDALVSLEKWLDKTEHVTDAAAAAAAAATASTTADEGGEVGKSSSSAPAAITTHVLLTNPPTASRDVYRRYKAALLEVVECEEGRSTLRRANDAVLARMRKIDELAAKQGLEVGGEGGERTGLVRAEKAASTIDQGKGGLLTLLEGAGEA